MGKLKNLVGNTYGDLVVLEQGPQVYSGRFSKVTWVCQCQCGVVKAIKSDALVYAGQTSCGCKAGAKIHGHRRTEEHKNGTPTYVTWGAMRNRCHNPKHSAYERYGAKGIHVCDEWRYSYPTFLADMGERPKGMTLDRIDSSKGYTKSNCRWATSTEQYENKRVVRNKQGKFSTILQSKEN